MARRYQTIPEPLPCHWSQEARTVEVFYTDASRLPRPSASILSRRSMAKEYNGVKFYADAYDDGDGTKDNPFKIKTDLQLAKLAQEVTNSKSQTMYSGKYFQLSDNIDLSKGIWMPIGTLNTDNAGFFGGILDGDGKTISNMKIYWTTNGTKKRHRGAFSQD